MPTAVIRYHWPAIALAVTFGLVLVSGPLVAKMRFGVGFSHPVNIRIDDEFFYFARVKDVLDGHPTLGNAYLWEHKSKPPSPLFLGEWVLAQPLRILGIGVVAGGVLYDFFFPFVAVLLTYGALYLVGRMRWLAFLGTAVLFFGFSPSEFARAVSPQFNFLFWLSQFLLSFLLITDAGGPRRRRFLAVLAAANLGLLFYLYPYYWTFYLVLLVLLGMWLAWERDWFGVKVVGAVVGGGLALAVPYFWMTFRAMRLPEYTETLRRINMIETHFPSGAAIVVPALILLGCAYYLLRRGILFWNRHIMFLGGGLVTAIVVTNQHLVTGRNFEFSSHYFMPALFWFVFFAAYALAALRHQGGRTWRMASAVAAGAGILVLVLNFPRVSLSGPGEEGRTRSRYLPILEWIDRNIEPDAVIYAPPALSEFIPIYTSANVYFAAPVRLFLLPTSEVLDRFALSYFFPAEPFNEEFVRERLRAVYGVYPINLAAHRANENKVRSLFGLEPLPVDPAPQELVGAVMRRYNEHHDQALWKSIERGLAGSKVGGRDRAVNPFDIRGVGAADGFDAPLKRYRVDYLIWDREAAPNAPFGNLEFLEYVREESGFVVFRVL